MEALADLFRNMDKKADAVKQYCLVVGLRVKEQGEQHADTWRSMDNLAMTLIEAGDLEEAENVRQRVVKLRTTSLGPKDPRTLRSMVDLAKTLIMQQKTLQAESILRRALEIQQTLQGPQNQQDTLSTMEYLGRLLADRAYLPPYEISHGTTDIYKEAEAMLRQTYRLSEEVLGKDHSDTLWSIQQLAFLLYNHQRYDESAVLYKMALSGCRTRLGPSHHLTALCIRQSEAVEAKLAALGSKESTTSASST
jgi:tetratricopeptide (TPR) repeat protein